MTAGDLLLRISLSIKDAQHSQHSLSLHKHPPNNGTKTYEKREVVNEETKDVTMEDVAITSSSTTPMRASARILAAKMKKLMQLIQLLHQQKLQWILMLRNKRKEHKLQPHWPA